MNNFNYYEFYKKSGIRATGLWLALYFLVLFPANLAIVLFVENVSILNYIAVWVLPFVALILVMLDIEVKEIDWEIKKLKEALEEI